MYEKLKRISLLLLLLVSIVGPHRVAAQAKPAYDYMQLFYYGTGPFSGPIGTFSPALRGQTDIMLAESTTYIKGVTAMVSGGNSNSRQMVTMTETTTADMMNPAQRKQEEERANQRRLESQEGLEKYARMMTDHKKAHIDRITQSLNTAAADGWEVVQMSNFGTDGMVYLLRKNK